MVCRHIVDAVDRNWNSLVSLRRIGPCGPCMSGTLSVDAGRTCQVPGLLAPVDKNSRVSLGQEQGEEDSNYLHDGIKPGLSLNKAYFVQDTKYGVVAKKFDVGFPAITPVLGDMTTSSDGHQIEFVRIFQMRL